MKLKKLFAFTLTLCTMIACVPFAFAFSNAGSSNINADNITFTAEEIQAQKEIDQRLNAAAAQEMATRGIADVISYSAPATLCQQQNSYYCGPASTKMVYEGITGDKSHNQAWFATKLGTTTSGTSSSQIASTLKSLTGKNYSVANAKSQTQQTFYNNIANSLKQKCAIVVNVKTIPGRYTSGSGHFMVVKTSQYDTSNGSIYYSYNDPHYNSNYYGTYRITNANLYSAVNSNAGNYVRAA